MAKEKAPVASAAPAEDRKRAIEAAMGQIEKMYGKGSIMRLGDQNNLQVDVIPTGSLSLDVALGVGGLPRGRIVEIYGPESSGKTTLALHVAAEAQKKTEELKEELKVLLLPKDPNDYKNVIVEIRGGAGGEEAALFAGSLFRMYSMYAERKGWKTEIMNENPTELGGYKEISFMIEGEGAYSRLKFESGVHRVQRVPETESQGRVHTSTVTVAVLPEAEEVEFTLDPADLQIDVFRSSGAGGQKVNKTSSAIRVTYLPTGMVVECQDERSQYKNKDKALKVLRSRLLEEKTAKQNAEIAGERRSQVGTGDRSERIRTYNFPQGRVSDHRIGLTLYKIEAIMNGDLDEIIDALVTADTAEKLKAED